MTYKFQPLKEDDPADYLGRTRVSLVVTSHSSKKLMDHINRHPELVRANSYKISRNKIRVVLYAATGRNNFQRRLILLLLKSLTTYESEYDVRCGLDNSQQ